MDVDVTCRSQTCRVSSRSRSRKSGRRARRRRHSSSRSGRSWRSCDRRRRRRHRNRHRTRRRSRDRRREYRSRRRSRSWRPRFASVSPLADPTARLPCGLTSVEVFDLLSREITPNDYELLLRLDKAVAQPVASSASIEALPSIRAADFKGRDCSICLAPFQEDSDVAAMQCKHQFHRGCISRWLSECRKTCPLCGKEAA
mmetsp:Transcript_105430/g.251082  ORF Transcript_105430/g.251082 Transcript_105430/m.251082 type:complete len:200 (-) Transcript_105430:291-890(-)